MANGHLFSLQPTFTQGLVIGQLSVLILLVLILKYLFLDSTKSPFETPSYHSRVNGDVSLRNQRAFPPEPEENPSGEDAESMEWFSTLLHQVRAVMFRCTNLHAY
jgi:maintenance of mitochondrial morphology protein 1